MKKGVSSGREIRTCDDFGAQLLSAIRDTADVFSRVTKKMPFSRSCRKPALFYRQCQRGLLKGQRDPVHGIGTCRYQTPDQDRKQQYICQYSARLPKEIQFRPERRPFNCCAISNYLDMKDNLFSAHSRRKNTAVDRDPYHLPRTQGGTGLQRRKAPLAAPGFRSLFTFTYLKLKEIDNQVLALGLCGAKSIGANQS